MEKETSSEWLIILFKSHIWKVAGPWFQLQACLSILWSETNSSFIGIISQRQQRNETLTFLFKTESMPIMGKRRLLINSYASRTDLRILEIKADVLPKREAFGWIWTKPADKRHSPTILFFITSTGTRGRHTIHTCTSATVHRVSKISVPWACLS